MTLKNNLNTISKFTIVGAISGWQNGIFRSARLASNNPSRSPYFPDEVNFDFIIYPIVEAFIDVGIGCGIGCIKVILDEIIAYCQRRCNGMSRFSDKYPNSMFFPPAANENKKAINETQKNIIEGRSK